MDWPMFRHVERQATRLSEMIRRVGVDAGKLVRLRGGDAYAEARTKCLDCRSSRECLLWLDADPKSREAPTFCPNFSLFESCKYASGSVSVLPSDPRYQYCKRVGNNVRLCRPETDCRREHGCVEPNCPLEKAFGFEAFDARMQAFATVFDLWPVGRVRQPDFP